MYLQLSDRYWGALVIYEKLLLLRVDTRNDEFKRSPCLPIVIQKNEVIVLINAGGHAHWSLQGLV